MKVICIDNSPGFYNCAQRLLVEGNVYTVVSADEDSYRLKEVPVDPLDNSGICFLSKRFIPLSSIDETELQKERELNLQTL